MDKSALQRYNRQYYLLNREKRQKKVKCVNCGRIVVREYITYHKKNGICIRKGNELREPPSTEMEVL